MSVQDTAAPAVGVDAVDELRSRRRDRGDGGSRALTVVAPILGIVGFLGLWQLWVWAFDIERFVLPAPYDILVHLKSDPSFYWKQALITMREAGLGFFIAFFIAMVGATIMAHSRVVERAVLPLAVLIQVTPIIAYAPAIVIWTGFGLKPILIMTSIVCFVPFLINGVIGLRSVDPNLLELARSVDASRWEVFVRLRLPSALPNIFGAARIAVGLALIGSVISEFFGGAKGGLGYSVKIAQTRNLSLQLWGSVYVLALIGAIATLLITGLERWVLHWHSSQRR